MTQKEKLRLVELLTSRYNVDELNELTTLLQKDGCKIEIIVKTTKCCPACHGRGTIQDGKYFEDCHICNSNGYIKINLSES